MAAAAAVTRPCRALLTAATLLRWPPLLCPRLRSSSTSVFLWSSCSAAWRRRSRCACSGVTRRRLCPAANARRTNSAAEGRRSDPMLAGPGEADCSAFSQASASSRLLGARMAAGDRLPFARGSFEGEGGGDGAAGRKCKDAGGGGNASRCSPPAPSVTPDGPERRQASRRRRILVGPEPPLTADRSPEAPGGVCGDHDVYVVEIDGASGVTKEGMLGRPQHPCICKHPVKPQAALAP